MRSRFLALLTTLVLILVLAPPAIAGEPGDKGNGYRIVSDADYTAVVPWSYPICTGGELDWDSTPEATWTLRDTFWEKADGTGEKWMMEGVLAFETLSQEHWERRVTNSIDPDTGIPNALNYMQKVRWFDANGVYATQDLVVRRAWNAAGDLMHSVTVETGTVCVRDTVLP